MQKSFISCILFLFCSGRAMGDCASDADMEKPVWLPDPVLCSTSNQAACRGWEPVGKEHNVFAVPPGPIRLFQWSKDDTSCFLLARGKPTKLMGTLCFDTTNCKVCAYDGKGTKLSDLVQGQKVTDDCSKCHTSGPLLPMRPLWEDAKHLTKDLNRLCSKLGGPIWVNAPSGWRQRDSGRVVPAPERSSCIQCHTHFVKSTSTSCNLFATALQSSNGSMADYAFDLDSPEEAEDCKAFSAKMGCALKCKK